MLRVNKRGTRTISIDALLAFLLLTFNTSNTLFEQSVTSYFTPGVKGLSDKDIVTLLFLGLDI